MSPAIQDMVTKIKICTKESLRLDIPDKSSKALYPALVKELMPKITLQGKWNEVFLVDEANAAEYWAWISTEYTYKKQWHMQLLPGIGWSATLPLPLPHSPKFLERCHSLLWQGDGCSAGHLATGVLVLNSYHSPPGKDHQLLGIVYQVLYILPKTLSSRITLAYPATQKPTTALTSGKTSHLGRKDRWF